MVEAPHPVGHRPVTKASHPKGGRPHGHIAGKYAPHPFVKHNPNPNAPLPHHALKDRGPRMYAFLADARVRPFSWDSSKQDVAQNCITFAARGVEAFTGVNPYVELCGSLVYTDAVSAYLSFKAVFGVSTLSDLLDLFFKPRSSLALIQQNDLITFTGPDGLEATGLAYPPRYYGVMVSSGLGSVQATELLKAWDPRTFTISEQFAHLRPS